MTVQVDTADSLVQLENHLGAQVTRVDRIDTFDMCDEPESQVLAPFAELHDALQWLDEKVTGPWRAANQNAKRNQSHHRLLARVAIVTGTAAIVLAVVQLSIKLTWPQLMRVALVLEAVAVVAAVVAVAVGLTAKFDRKWLGHRHLAERLRMLKFRALEQIWCLEHASWRSWVEGQLEDLKDAADFNQVKSWSEEGEIEPYHPPVIKSTLDSRSTKALTIYYRFKRLDFQAHYFQSRRDSLQLKPAAGVI